MAPDGPLVVLANPSAGHGKAGKLIGRADRLLTELRVEHRVRVSSSPEDLEALARASAGEGAAIVAALGGDGSVSLVANGLLATEATLAVLPGGTGDDFASAIGARSFDQAVRLLAAPKVHRVDAVKVTAGSVVRYFVNVAGAGFDSEVNEKANATRLRLGTTGTYVAALLRMLPRFTPAHYEIDVDGTMLSLDAMLAIVGSGISYGGGMKVLPSAMLDDGELDVCIVEALSVPAFLRAFPRVYRGTHTTHPKVRMMRARRVAVSSNRLVPVYADGERIGPLPAVFQVQPGALAVVVGPDAKGIT